MMKKPAPRKNRALSIRIEASDARRLQAVAKARHFAPSTYARALLMEAIQKEEHALAGGD